MSSFSSAQTASYNRLLRTRDDEVHFGAGIPGNRHLKLVARAQRGAVAMDVGCGSGENVVAMGRLGYSCVGIDASNAQLALARALCRKRSINAKFERLPVEQLGDVGRQFDVILCVGVLHFTPRLTPVMKDFFRSLKPGGQLVISVPHPIDMLADYKDGGVDLDFTFGPYFPSGRLIKGARYWRRFGGRVETGYTFTEYVHQVSSWTNSLLGAGLELMGMFEPLCDHKAGYPCSYVNGDKTYLHTYSRRLPQYLILRARRPFA